MKILISGSSSGIGNYLVRRLGSAGHNIWGLARSSQREFQLECQAQNLSFRYSESDVSSWQKVSAARQEVGGVWSALDALICGAGIQGPIGRAMSLDPLAWSTTARVNLDGTFFTIRAFFDLLRQHDGSRAKVLCFAGGGATSPRVNFSAYAAAKAGVVRLVENLAQEWNGQTIDINALAPGAIHTRMTEEVLAMGPQVVGEKEYAQASQQKAGTDEALEKVGGLVDFLLSPDSDGISGKLLSAPWDPWHRLPQHLDELEKSDIYCLRRIMPEDRGKKW